MIKCDAFARSGISERWCVFSINLSQIKINDGKTVTQQITPIITPFAITIPKLAPNANVIKHSAANPATVVTELPVMDLNVFEIACAIARSLSPSNLILLLS